MEQEKERGLREKHKLLEEENRKHKELVEQKRRDHQEDMFYRDLLESVYPGVNRILKTF